MSIPASIMRLVNLRKNHKALVSVKEGKILVEPVGDLLSLEDSLVTTKKRLSNKRLHELFAKNIVRGR